MFSAIPHTGIDAVWPEVLPWIALACKRMRGRMDEQDIRTALLDRNMQLWIYRAAHGVAAICVTEIINYPKKKYARICIGCGAGREHWQRFRHDIEEWARQQGCHGIEAEARPGWERIFTDYERTHVFLEKELK